MHKEIQIKDEEEIEECICEHCRDKRAYQDLIKKHESFTKLYIV